MESKLDSANTESHTQSANPPSILRIAESSKNLCEAPKQKFLLLLAYPKSRVLSTFKDSPIHQTKQLSILYFSMWILRIRRIQRRIHKLIESIPQILRFHLDSMIPTRFYKNANPLSIPLRRILKKLLLLLAFAKSRVSLLSRNCEIWALA